MTRRPRIAASLTSLALLGTTPALAAPGNDGSAASDARAEPAPKAPRLVVVTDVAATVTDNSLLAAALYETARDQGYDPAGKLDVEGIAARASLVHAGTVTIDESELVELRKTLDVAVLVRVTKDASGRARILAVTNRGVASRVVGSDAASLKEALSAMVPSVYRPPPKKSDDDYRGERMGPAALLLDEKTQKESVSVREAWVQRGGFRPTYGAVAMASATQIKHVPFTANDGRTGTADSNGVGGGIGVRFGLVYLPVPDPNLGVGSFVTFRCGVGLDTNVLYVSKPTGYEPAPSTNVTRGSQALWVSSAPLYVGLGIASGRFAGPTNWRGAVIGFGYAPAAQFSMDLAGTKGDFRFNPAGIEASVDITRLDTTQGETSASQIRVWAAGLMPMDDSRPGFASLGIGAIWY
jgi:hypothetical protein